VNWLIHGHLENPTVVRSASSLLTNLWRDGRLQPLCYGDTEVGSVSLSEEFHPIDAWGRVEPRIWLFGSLTRGCAVLHPLRAVPEEPPSAFLDAQRCIEAILG